MAIIMRNGPLADFDPDKMRTGELAVVTDARELHVTFEEGDSPKVVLEDEAFTEADFHKKSFVGPQIATQRNAINGVQGTQILNPFRVDRTCVHAGYAWDPSKSAIRFYAIFGSHFDSGQSIKTYIIFLKDSESPARELTIEDSEATVSLISDATAYYKYTVTISCTHHVDVRFARVVYDRDNNVIDTIYSAQYRYEHSLDPETQADIVSRTKTQTAPTSPLYVVDLGFAYSGSVSDKLFTSQTKKNIEIPLITSLQPVSWYPFVPDDLFDGHPYGLMLIAEMGDGTKYSYGAFDKADGGAFLVTLTPTAADLSGTMDKTPEEIQAALFCGKRIIMYVPSLEVDFEATQYGLGFVAGNVTYNPGDGWKLITIITNPDYSTYSTQIFNLS